MNKCSEEFSVVPGINVRYAEVDGENMQLEVGKYWKV